MVTCFKFKVPTIYLCAQYLSWKKSLKAISELWEGHRVDVKCSIHLHVDITNRLFFYAFQLCAHILMGFVYLAVRIMILFVKFSQLVLLTKGN